MNWCLLCSERLQNMFTVSCQIIHSSPSQLREGTFCCIAVALQCDPACRSQWMDTMSFYLVPKELAQQFFLSACCEKHGNGVVMTPSLSLKVTCIHVFSLHCSVPPKLTWQGAIDPELHESCTMDAHCAALLCLVTSFAAADSLVQGVQRSFRLSWRWLLSWKPVVKRPVTLLLLPLCG